MILVDTSVWIDHLHRTEPDLVRELDRDEIGCHTLVIQELALGWLRDRHSVLDLLGSLSQFPLLRPTEILSLVESHRLCGRGLSPADAHLLGSCLIAPGGRLWTRDKRLRSAASDLAVPLVPWR